MFVQRFETCTSPSIRSESGVLESDHLVLATGVRHIRSLDDGGDNSDENLLSLFKALSLIVHVFDKKS